MTASPQPVFRCLSLLCYLASLICLPAGAANFYWDADPATVQNQNGSGIWVSGGTAANANWTSGAAAGGANAAWQNGNHVAVLGATSGYSNNGTGGTVTLGENITLNRIDKSGQAGAYILDAGTGPYTITLTGTSAGIGNNNPNAAAALTLHAAILGDNTGFMKFNNGAVILTGANAWTGGTRITAHAASGSSSVLQIGNGGTTGTLGNGDVSFSSGSGGTGGQSVLAFNRSDSVSLTQNLVSATATDLNKGILRQAGSGTLVVASDNAAFTGTAEVTAGTLQIGDGLTSGALPSVTSISVSSGGTLRFDRTDTVTFNAPVTGAGRILKAGSGTLVLGSNASTFGGGTVIEAGSLQLANNDALPTNTTVTFSGPGVLDLNGFDQTVGSLSVANGQTGRVIGATGSTLTAGGANLSLGGTVAGATASLDLSGLAEFVFNGPTRVLSVGGQFVSNDAPSTVSNGILTLAQANIITAATVNVGSLNAGGGNHENSGTLLLGQSNTITAANFNLGDVKNQGFVRFADGVTGGTLTLRGSNAAQRMDILIGKHDSNGVVVDQSVFDTTSGTLDALVGTLTLGVTNDRSRSGLGRFSMGAGLLDATTIVLGRRISSLNSAAGAGASPTGILELNGGTLLVRTLIFADKQDTGTLGTVGGIFNFSSGLLRAQTLQAGAGTTGVSRILRWSGGSIETYDASTDLSISDITLTLEGSGSRLFNPGSGRTVAISGPIVNGTTAPTTAFTKQGAGTLVLGGTGSTHTGSIVLEAGTLRTAGNEAISNTASLQFTGNALLDVQGNTETISALNVAVNVTGTVQGAGSLILSGGPNWNIGGGTASTATVLNMTGLGSFTFDSINSDITWGAQNNAASNSVTVHLAQNNLVKAKSLGIASVTSGNVAGRNLSTVNLGQSNSVFASAITVGSYKSDARLQFASGITTGSLQIRATNGTGRASLLVGRGQSGAVATDALVDLSGGSVDALLSTLTLGQNDNSGTQASNTTATFLMNAGTLDATSIVLGELTNNSTIETYQANGIFTLSGPGTVKASTLTFSQRSGTNNGAGLANGTFNLSGGTLQAATLQRGTSPRGSAVFNWNSGTVENYDAATDLTVTNVNLTLNGAGSRNFNVTAGRSATVNSQVVDGTSPGSAAFTKTGTGTLRLLGANTYTGSTTIQQGVLFAGNSSGSATGTGSLSISSAGTLSGTGRLAPLGSAGVLNEGTLKPGNVGGATAGVLTLDLGGTTGGMVSTGTLNFDLFTNAGDNSSVAGSSDRLSILQAAGGDISLGGTLHLSLGEGSLLTSPGDFQEGNRWLLIDWSGLTGGLPSVNFGQVTSSEINLPSTLKWSYDFDQNGLYAVIVVVPEPGRAGLLLMGACLVWLRRRRR